MPRGVTTHNWVAFAERRKPRERIRYPIIRGLPYSLSRVMARILSLQGCIVHHPGEHEGEHSGEGCLPGVSC
jgi:hypothetical protein